MRRCRDVGQAGGRYRAASGRAGAGIPILFGVDAVHGHSNLPGATLFPHNIGLGAARDPELLQRIGVVAAAPLSGSGIDWTFAPTVAVPQDLRWGRSYESYSADPALTAAYARALTVGLQGPLTAAAPLGADKVAATVKHFVADGGTAGGKDQGDARIGEAELVKIPAAGYAPAIEAGALSVMASFSSWNGVKAHGTAICSPMCSRAGWVLPGWWSGIGTVRASCRAAPAPIARSPSTPGLIW